MVLLGTGNKAEAQSHATKLKKSYSLPYLSLNIIAQMFLTRQWFPFPEG
jgi:hypothetical protein